MITKRKAIISFRKKVQERNADSTFTNQDLYQSLMEQAFWLIKREVSAGRIYGNRYFFQTIRGMEVIEVPSIPACTGVKTNCKIFRIKDKLPEMWQENTGPIIKDVTSLDGSTNFTLISANQWKNKINNPYQNYSQEKYGIFSDGYIYFPAHNPHMVNVEAFFKDDVNLFQNPCSECGTDTECLKFLDTEFMVPDWVLAELYAKALQALFPSKQLPDDSQIDKNTNRKA